MKTKISIQYEEVGITREKLNAMIYSKFMKNSGQSISGKFKTSESHTKEKQARCYSIVILQWLIHDMWMRFRRKDAILKLWIYVNL